MSLPLVIGYRHTGIIVKDMKESLYFYRDILGLKVIQDFFGCSLARQLSEKGHKVFEFEKEI